MSIRNRLLAEEQDNRWHLAPPSSPQISHGIPQTLELFDLSDLHYDNTISGIYSQLNPSMHMLGEPSPFSSGSEKQITMLDLPLQDFSTGTNDLFSGLLHDLPDLDTTSPHKEIVESAPNSNTQHCPNSGPCCFAFASRILKGLYIPSTSCLSTIEELERRYGATQTAPRTADSVLTANSQAMLELSKMLRCSCSLKPQLQMILATICDKLVAWYYAMAYSKQNFDPEAIADLPKHTWDSNIPRRERVICQPVKIGEYCLSETTESQVTARVVLSHLQKLDYLIIALSRRIKDTYKKPSLSRHQRDRRAHFFSDANEIFANFSDRLTAYLVAQSQDAQKEMVRLIGT